MKQCNRRGSEPQKPEVAASTQELPCWVGCLARVTRADRRRMMELREETGLQKSLTERLVRNRLQWAGAAGHVERMADD